MATNYETVTSLLTATCNAIREKEGSTGLINHQDIPSRIQNLKSSKQDILSLASGLTKYTEVFEIDGEQRTNVLVQPSDFSDETTVSWSSSTSYFSHSIQNVEGSENGAAAVITTTSTSASSYDNTFWFDTTVDSNISEAKSYLIAVRAKASKNITSNLPIYMCYCHPTGSTSKTSISFSFPVTTEWQIFYAIVNIPVNYYMYDNTLAFYPTGDGVKYYVDWMAAYDITGSSFANMTFGARATAYSEHVRSGKTFYKDGILYSGTMADATVSIDSNNGITIDSGTGVITAKATYNSGYLTSGSTTNTKQLTTKGSTTWTPNTKDQTISAGTYLTGIQTIKGDSNLIASNIKNGVSIFGIQGSMQQGIFPDYTSYTSSVVLNSGEAYNISPKTYLPNGLQVTATGGNNEVNNSHCAITPTSKYEIFISRSELNAAVDEDEEIKMIVIMLTQEHMSNISSSRISGGIYDVRYGEFFGFRKGSTSRFLYYADEYEITYSNNINGLSLYLANDVNYFFDEDLQYEIFLITTWVSIFSYF